MNDTIVQVWIAITGGVSVWLMADPSRRWLHRLGCFIGFLGQPCWWLSTFHQQQWGMFALSLVFTVSFLRGMFLRPSLLQDPT